jgi:signal transduction histidine kinase/DNA-binding response OmpR family regulator
MLMDDIRLDITNTKPLILIADDDKNNRDLLSRMLKRENYRTESASDGNETVQKTRDLLPDLVLLDVQMPGLTGFEVLQELRKEEITAHIPVVVLTAAARDPLDVVKGLGLGADDYLLKPFNPSELVARVMTKLRAHRLEESLRRRTEELEALVRVGSELNRGLTLEDLADRLLAVAVEQCKASKALLILFSGSKRLLERQHGLSRPKTDLLGQETLATYILKHDEAVLVGDVDTDGRVKAIFNSAQCASGIATPLKHQGEIHGVLVLGHEGLSHFSSHDLRVLRSIGEQATLAIRNAQLYKQLAEYAHGLESMVETRTAALQSAQSQLMRAEKLAALGTLAAGVAHEVNNPLQPILSSLEMALEDIDAGRAVERELIEYAINDVVRIKRIVSTLLDFARPSQSSQSLTVTDVNTLITEVLALANKQLQVHGIKVDTRFGESRRISANADQLKQVFLNLIVNAMDAMKNGGGHLTVQTSEQDGFAVVVLSDTGTGIPQETLQKIFDPFFTTKPSGTGLGLSVSHSIIEGHGGSIAVTSQVGKGSTFRIQLPVMRE